MLRAIRADLGEEAIDLSEVQVDPEKPLIETVGATVEQGIELLSKVGLNDAFFFCALTVNSVMARNTDTESPNSSRARNNGGLWMNSQLA